MKQKLFFTLTTLLFSAHLLSAQFIVKDVIFSPNGISNEGNVSGYEAQEGPWGIWMPDSGNVITPIGGIAPGQGVGGQARSSANGDFISGTGMGTDGPEMSRYSRATGEWTTLGGLGFSLDNTVGGGFSISGDGSTVVGLSWGDTTGGLGDAHAVAHNDTEGIIDLGTLFPGASTRANAASHDGSVVVGWQDFNGPWKSAVWRKNPAGGYFPNEYILIDTAGNPSDEYNQIGECSAISADGNWIGGYGDFANNDQPWIWSSDSGVINLGTFPDMGNGYVSSMTADASIVVGWFDGPFFGDPQTPFIWTRTGGLQELSGYIRTVLGDSIDGHLHIYTADCISPNGSYIAGYGVNDRSSNYFVYRVSLVEPTGIRPVAETGNINIYPNPASDHITIENTNEAVLTIIAMDGKQIDKIEMNGKQVIDLSNYPSGIYCLRFQSADGVQMRKIAKE